MNANIQQEWQINLGQGWALMLRAGGERRDACWVRNTHTHTHTRKHTKKVSQTVLCGMFDAWSVISYPFLKLTNLQVIDQWALCTICRKAFTHWRHLFCKNNSHTRKKKRTHTHLTFVTHFQIQADFFPNWELRTNASSNHDGRAEQTSTTTTSTKCWQPHYQCVAWQTRHK